MWCAAVSDIRCLVSGGRREEGSVVGLFCCYVVGPYFHVRFVFFSRCNVCYLTSTDITD